jgi:hypothetical protein
VRYSAEARATVSKHFNSPTPFVALLAMATVEYVVEVGVFHMELIWIDSDDWACSLALVRQKIRIHHTILLVHLVYLENILASAHDIMVEFIPQSQSCQFWPWKFCDRTEIQAINSQTNKVRYKRTRCYPGNVKGRDCRRTCHSWPPLNMQKCLVGGRRAQKLRGLSRQRLRGTWEQKNVAWWGSTARLGGQLGWGSSAPWAGGLS